MSRCTPLVLLAVALMAAACSVEEERIHVQTLALGALDAEHPILSLPMVERLSLDQDVTPTFMSGQLGFELADVGAAFALDDSVLTLEQTDQDELGLLIQRYSQKRNGLPVVGGDLRLARQSDGSIHAASARSWTKDWALKPGAAQIDASQASSLALAETRGATHASEANLVYIAPSRGGSPVLAWHTVLQGRREGMPVLDDVYVDASQGAIVDRNPRVHSSRHRETYNAGGIEQVGSLARAESSPASGDVDIDQAHEAARVTYDCLFKLFGRDSYDGNGAELVSVANYGQGFENAFWDGSLMVYGDGMATTDVGTHEFVHAVTEYTANMVYQNEPGALNEAWSDILSAVCDADAKGSASDTTWKIGEALPMGTLRFMDNPTRDGYSSDHYQSRYQGDEDEGGVHFNSGIANLAFYLLSEGGSHPAQTSGVNVKSIGIKDAGQIFYRALSTYMNTNTDFAGARVATEQAADDLFGAMSAQSISVSEAWSSVGVGGPPPDRSVEEPGQETDPTDPDPSRDDAAGTGTVVGSCSTGGTSSTSFTLLVLLAMVAFERKRARSEA